MADWLANSLTKCICAHISQLRFGWLTFTLWSCRGRKDIPSDLFPASSVQVTNLVMQIYTYLALDAATWGSTSGTYSAPIRPSFSFVTENSSNRTSARICLRRKLEYLSGGSGQSPWNDPHQLISATLKKVARFRRTSCVEFRMWSLVSRSSSLKIKFHVRLSNRQMLGTVFSCRKACSQDAALRA